MRALALLRAALALGCLGGTVAVHLQPRTDGLSNASFRQELKNSKDLQYYGLLKVGNQTLKGILDTGSLELVVLSDKCNYWCGTEERLYHAGKSKLYENGTLSLTVSYGSGDLLGQEAYDQVSIGPFSSPRVPFWEVVDANMPVLLNSDFEAIVGLGIIPHHVKATHAKGASAAEPGPDHSKIRHNSYAVLLHHLNITHYSVCFKPEVGASGYVTWNDDGVDKTPHLFHKIHIVDSGYWMTRLTDVRLGDERLACRRGCAAVFDSGTSLIAVPDMPYRRLRESVAAFAPDCASVMMDMPNLNFKLDGRQFSLPPDSYIGAVTGTVPQGMTDHFHKVQNTSCQASLMTIKMKSSLGDAWIFGMPFFRSYYTVFYQGYPHKLYASRHSGNCEPTKSAQLELIDGGKRQIRPIDASKLRMPPWLHRAKSLGRLEEGPSQSKSRRLTPHHGRPSAAVLSLRHK